MLSPNLASILCYLCSFISFGPIFSPNTWRFLPVFRKTICFWAKLGSEIFQNIRPWLKPKTKIIVSFAKHRHETSDHLWANCIFFSVSDFNFMLCLALFLCCTIWKTFFWDENWCNKVFLEKRLLGIFIYMSLTINEERENVLSSCILLQYKAFHKNQKWPKCLV